MGLTKSSVGKGAIDAGLRIEKRSSDERIIALAGNPNVGKSTVFNGLTGMKQHTGNWPGKTVANAVGRCESDKHTYLMVDIPGTYSLMAHSAEEEIARDFICFGAPDATVVVCDATCLERNMNLVLQIMEISKRTVVCVNLLDEAKRKKIRIDTALLSERLGVPVVGIVARKKKSLSELVSVLDSLECDQEQKYTVKYRDEIEKAIGLVATAIEKKLDGKIDSRWAALRLIDSDTSLVKGISGLAGEDITKDADISSALEYADEQLREKGFWGETLKESIVSSLVSSAEEICEGAVIYENREYSARDRKIDRILTSKRAGYPLMLALLAAVFWITITGANYISDAISLALFGVESMLRYAFEYFRAPDWLCGIAVDGIWCVLSWVVSVMLPPMAIFFPLFTLLEDLGYLPRIAYNLDKPFCRCNACGKQALSMCMGFGCNAAGVVGCRIIDSPRERLLATLTNSFVPCNGKFPMLISLITVFIVGASTFGASVLSALVLTCLILLGVLLTFFTTWLLSKTLLKGVPSSFTLELPPYRKPQVGKVIVRSVFDRTLFVLGRTVAVAAPAGAIIWIMANVTVGDVSLLSHCADFLDPFARFFGLDGVILLAFILGFPANEIVVPIIVMAYMAKGTIVEVNDLTLMREIFVENGWTVVTAICVMLFSLCHWPCSTTLMTVKKETGSIGWTLLAALLPTVVGLILCALVANLSSLL